jgi:hypothetical protein
MSGNFLMLWDAVKGGDLAAVARLLAAGANPDALVSTVRSAAWNEHHVGAVPRVRS